MSRRSWNPLIALVGKPASAIGAWDGPTAYYLRVPEGIGPLVMGGTVLWDNPQFWRGTPEQVEQALETIRRFIGQPGNEMILDVEIRAHETEPGLEYRKLFDPGGWTEWEFVPLPQGPQGEEGVQGDRYEIFAEREAPNSYATLYRQLQVIGPEGGYIDQGEPEELTIVYDGWVQVGFFQPYLIDNEDGTITLWRQWYCRVGADSNLFLPEGEPESMGSAVLPPGPRGPVGGHYFIQSENPADHVAEFYRQFRVWDEVEEEWVNVGEPELFGGVVAPAGPEGRVGDYYLPTADNPDANTIRFYRQRRHGVTGAALGDPEIIGSAIAVQGPPGEPGPVGPPGSYTGITPQYGWQSVSEWQRLGFLSEKFIGWVSETIVNGQEFRAQEQAGVLLSAAVATAAIGSIFGPPGAVAGAVFGFGYTAVGLIFNAADSINYLPYKEEASRAQFAKDLYCSLIPYRDLSLASIEAWVSLNEQLPVDMNAMYADPSATARGLLARHWREQGILRAQEEMTMYYLTHWYDPAFDYSTLPCTPDIGNDQEVFDFTIDEQGWELFTDYGAFGQYQAGQGWAGTLRNGEGDMVAIKHTFPEEKTITHCEVLYDVASVGGSRGSFFLPLPLPGSIAYTAFDPATNGVWVPQAGQLPQTGTTFVLWFASWATPAGLLIKRISVTFE